jgi:hypothetical protein
MAAPAPGPGKQATWVPKLRLSSEELNERILTKINTEYLILWKQRTMGSHFYYVNWNL